MKNEVYYRFGFPRFSAGQLLLVLLYFCCWFDFQLFLFLRAQRWRQNGQQQEQPTEKQQKLVRLCCCCWCWCCCGVRAAATSEASSNIRAAAAAAVMTWQMRSPTLSSWPSSELHLQALRGADGGLKGAEKRGKSGR